VASLAETLYTAWRSRQPDPTAHPAWGNLDTEQRAVWDYVEDVAKFNVVTPLIGQLMIAGVPTQAIEDAIGAAGLRRTS
jgi:hypothetical protein